jgi:hypothetical protein
MDLRVTGREGVKWMQLAQDTDRWQALVRTVMNPRVLAPRNQLTRPRAGCIPLHYGLCLCLCAYKQTRAAHHDVVVQLGR